MPTSSNLYAEKVFSEHPLGLWPIDEESSYINYVSAEASDLSNSSAWLVSKGSVSTNSSIQRPFSSVPAFNITNDNSFEIDLVNDSITNGYFNPILKTFSVGFYVMASTNNVQSFELGLLSNNFGDSFYENEETQTVLFDIKSYGRWHFYQKTFDLFPENVIDLSQILVPVGSAATFYKDSHGLQEGDQILLTSTGQLPRNIFPNTVYFVRYIDENSFSISLQADGDLVVATSAGVGVHSFIPVKTIGLRFKFLLTDSEVASIFINGLTVGQNCEEFQENSLGVIPQEINGINIDQTFYGIPASSYGLSENNAFYLVKNNQLLAKNNNIPLVFGSESVTSIYPHPYGQPSMVFPGFGFLNEAGKFRTHTAEFWLRINANTNYSFRIFGPVNSEDGLYIDGPFLVLKIGRFVNSHYVGDLYRPMLINIVVFPGGASLIINGEKVFDLSYSIDEVSFPTLVSEENRENDWVGFYSSNEILSFDIDCFAIYPYRVSTSIAKRRYVYGQAVEFPENITALYNGKSFVADFPFSNYGTNYSYPDIGRWNRGVLNNLIPEKNSLRPPSYSLPTFIFNNKTQDQFVKDLRDNKRASISLKPSKPWANTEGYIFFDKLNIAQENMRCMYGVFEANLDQVGQQILFKLDDALGLSYLEAVLEKKTVALSEIVDNDFVIFKKEGHGLSDGDLVRFEDKGFSLPINVSLSKEYRVSLIDEESFYLSESINGPSVSSYRVIDSVAIDDPGTIFVQKHGLSNNDVVVFKSTGRMPEGIVRGQEYYVLVTSENSFMISENMVSESSTLDDFVSISSNGTGTRSVRRVASNNLELSRFLVSYYFSKKENRVLISESRGISLGHLFVAGLDLDKFSNFFGGEVSAFLKNSRQLKIYVGGSKNFEKTFSGKIYRFGFSNPKNSTKLGFLFDVTGIPFLRYQFDGNGALPPEDAEIVDGGMAYQKFVDDVMSHKASYTLLVKNELGNSELEIATSSSWQDYLPLSYFAKPVLKRDGKKENDLEFFQFNMDYPTPEIFRNSCCDTSRSDVRAYVSFQLIQEGANKQSSQFSQTFTAPQNNLIIPGSDWRTSRYEVVNNSLIYLPSNIDKSELAIVVDLEIESEGILFRPIRIKSLSLSGRSLNEISPNNIVSRFGARAYPYTKYGFYIDHDDLNPFSIYRDSTPYLYLTKYSGVKLQGNFDPSIKRGIAFPINEEKKTLFSLSALQFSMRFENPEKLDEDILLFELQSDATYYGIMAKSIHPDNERLYLYAVDSDGNEVHDLGFYLNGKLTSRPTISIKEWNMLGIALANPMRMNSRTGEFRLVGPINFNNFSYYAFSIIQEAQAVITATRYKNFFEDQYFGIKPSELYALYTGTNKLIAYDENILKPKQYRYGVLLNNALRTETFKAV